jgi:spore germination protein YaaH
LGIPLYGYHWYTGAPIKTGRDDAKNDAKDEEKPNLTGDYIGAPNALLLAQAYNGKVTWDAEDHSAYYYIYRDQMREWIFFTDLRTFKDRYALLQENGLQGFSSWVLGEEDPAIWTFLPHRSHLN